MFSFVTANVKQFYDIGATLGKGSFAVVKVGIPKDPNFPKVAVKIIDKKDAQVDTLATASCDLGAESVTRPRVLLRRGCRELDVTECFALARHCLVLVSTTKIRWSKKSPS